MGPTRVFVGGPFSAAMGSEGGKATFDARLKQEFERTFAAVQSLGAVLLSAHVADHFGAHFLEAQMVNRDNEWARSCDVYVAMLTLDPSGHPYRTDGTFVETGLAVASGKRVLLVIEDLSHPAHSYYVKNLHHAPGVRIVDFSEWVNDREGVLREEIEAVKRHEADPVPIRVQRTQTTDPAHALAILADRLGPEEVEVRGVSLIVLPGVFSPSVSHSPDFLIASWAIPRGSRVLDLGSGSGVLGIFALLEGAGSLTAIDANPLAVDNTAMNLARLKLTERGHCLLGKGYTAVPPGETFDVILLSPPFWDRAPETPLANACYDEGHGFMRASIAGARAHLATGGKVYMIFSDQGDLGLLVKTVRNAGLAIDDLKVFRPSMSGGHVRLFLALSADS